MQEPQGWLLQIFKPEELLWHIPKFKRLGGVSEVVRDPSLVLALVTGSVLTGFLLVAHACCLGITAQHFLPLVQICSFAG
ncbi:hypothetical protein [Roseibium aggregatum]|uniref:hypothetical protein n=1 Tax=Roseibium aggregatum TaxID=187304 RepID=UPI003A98304C